MRDKVHQGGGFLPPAVGYAVCNDHMRELSSHGLQATGRLRVSNYTRHATTPRATVLAPSGTGSALEGHSSGTAHVLYRTSCPLRVPRRCWPRRLRPKASKRRAAARKCCAYAEQPRLPAIGSRALLAPTQSGDALRVRHVATSRARCASTTAQGMLQRRAAPHLRRAAAACVPHPIPSSGLATGRSLDARGDDHRRLRCR